MPNSLQWSFLASFAVTFASLFVASSFLVSKLNEAGYDPSKLILIGLDKKNTKDPVMAVEQSLPEWANTLNIQIASLVLAVLSSVFIFWKFSAKRKPVLDPKEFKEFPLIEKTQVSPNTAIYRFGLPRADDLLGLPIGQHITISAEIAGKNITRSYTPTSSDDDLGHFDLLVKAYEKGNISRYLSLLKLGDKIRVKGPKGQFTYHPSLTKQIGMIAGGTGITPMLQIIRAALKNPLDQTKLSLIYANVNEEDVLLRKELDDLAAKHSSRFKVYYVLNNPPSVWKGGVGFVTKEQIQEHLPATDADIKVLLCGPPPMMTAMKKHLAELKYPAPRTVSKLEDQVFLF